MPMDDEKIIDVLLQLNQQNLDRGKHHQDQRAAVANILLILAGGLLALTALDQEITRLDVFPASFLLAIGITGAVWSVKQHERYDFYSHRARAYKRALAGRLLPAVDLLEIERAAHDDMKKKYGRLLEHRVWWMWVALHGFVAALGLGLLILSARA